MGESTGKTLLYWNRLAVCFVIGFVAVYSPLEVELEKTFKFIATAPSVETMLDALASWAKDAPYFWIEEKGAVFLFSYGQKRESQVIRRVIAQQAGIGEQWNWRLHPTQDLARRVAKELVHRARTERFAQPQSAMA